MILQSSITFGGEVSQSPALALSATDSFIKQPAPAWDKFPHYAANAMMSARSTHSAWVARLISL